MVHDEKAGVEKVKSFFQDFIMRKKAPQKSF